VEATTITVDTPPELEAPGERIQEAPEGWQPVERAVDKPVDREELKPVERAVEKPVVQEELKPVERAVKKRVEREALPVERAVKKRVEREALPVEREALPVVREALPVEQAVAPAPIANLVSLVSLPRATRASKTSVKTNAWTCSLTRISMPIRAAWEVVLKETRSARTTAISNSQTWPPSSTRSFLALVPNARMNVVLADASSR